jgi:hypothetical protein
LKGWEAELGTTPFVTVTGVPTAVAVPVHVEPEKNSYVTVPPALLVALCKTAESVTDPPTGTLDADNVVITVGLVFVTVNANAADGGDA